MAKAIQINKVSVRDRLVADVEVSMADPQDHDFSPRARVDGNILHLSNEGDGPESSFELDSEQLTVAERDRMVELRIKFSAEGMHGVLTHKTPKPMSGPNSKKLAEPRWKTVLPLSM